MIGTARRRPRSAAYRLYAILPAGDTAPAELAGVDDEPLSIVRCGPVSAVVGRCDAGTVSMSLPAPPAPLTESNRRRLVRYDRVVRAIASHAEAMLPARFGVAAKSRAAVQAQVRERSAALKAALAMVAGREQMTLRVWRVGGSSRLRLAAAQHPTGPSASGRGYLEGRMAAQREALLADDMAEIRRRLASIIRVERAQPGPVAGTATYYHLVDRGAAAAYRRVVRTAARANPQVRIRTSGPFPPYAFGPGAVRDVGGVSE